MRHCTQLKDTALTVKERPPRKYSGQRCIAGNSYTKQPTGKCVHKPNNVVWKVRYMVESVFNRYLTHNQPVWPCRGQPGPCLRVSLHRAGPVILGGCLAL
eukprot:TRINITY_DN12704_c0_g1_i1.p2 TRINITY_DN12704_c0_g1~~TRINITY_DN12704_c0_g1_i1.p2  ORF type:complete len:100 (+),score=3.05 TRINITY_DN12704_c0_g1_i1:100-399(+)